MPKVSVIIPVYGVERYIERCARSLFEQTLDDIEYLFIDDCTPDRSIEVLYMVLDEYRNRKSQVIVHRMEQNSGQAVVRMWGIQNATGEYVIHCDSDDWVDADMYRAMYEKAKEDCADVVVCDYYLNNGMVNLYTKAFERIGKRDFIEDMLSKRVSWALWNKMVKRPVDAVIFPRDAMGEDMALTTQYVYNCHRLTFIRKPLYYYALNPTSITQLKDKDSIVKKYRQFLSNSQITISLLDHSTDKSYFKDAVVALKWDVKCLLWQFIRDRELFAIWINTYSEINLGVLLCPLIKFSDKIKYLLTFVRIYPKNR